ncbi:MAG: hypothetical protein JXB14_02640 [Candidatus Altiarchaeota archaeon]|nr:hypothetical protein [Candidatus Altiarchaeota archaeon]
MNRLKLIIGIIVFGSLWGFLEASFGGFLHFIHLPQKGIIMASLAIGIMSYTRAMYHRPGMELAMGVVAAALKSSNALFLGADVIRPMLAILLEAFVFDLAITTLSKINAKDYMKAVAGALGGWGGTAVFSFVLAYVLQIGFWAKLGFFGILEYLYTEGAIIAFGCAIAAVLGAKIYRTSRLKFPHIYSMRSTSYYQSSAAFISVFWVLGVFLAF